MSEQPQPSKLKHMTAYEIQKQIVLSLREGYWIFVLGRCAYPPIVQKVVKENLPVPHEVGDLRQWAIQLNDGVLLHIVAISKKKVSFHQVQSTITQTECYVPDGEDISGQTDIFVPVDANLPGFEEAEKDNYQRFDAFLKSSFLPPATKLGDNPDLPVIVPQLFFHESSKPSELVEKTDWLATGNAFAPWTRVMLWQSEADGEFSQLILAETRDHLDMVDGHILSQSHKFPAVDSNIAGMTASSREIIKAAVFNINEMRESLRRGDAPKLQNPFCSE